MCFVIFGIHINIENKKMSSKKSISKKQSKATTGVWLSRLDPHDIPGVTYGTTLPEKKQSSIAKFVSPPANKSVRTIPKPTKKKKQTIDLSNSFNDETEEKEVIDMTGDGAAIAGVPGKLLPGTPISLIRSTYSLYFSYDPRGSTVSPLKIGYCKHCRCPLNYCAEKVFGHICYKRCVTKIYNKGTHHHNEDTIENMYRRTYTKMLYAKMCFNNITYSVRNLYHVPKCMKVGSYGRLQARVKKDNEKDDKLLWDDDFDMTKKQLDVFAARHCRNNDDKYDYSVDFSKQEDEEENNYIKDNEEKKKTKKKKGQQ
jgi:hypothetical protein